MLEKQSRVTIRARDRMATKTLASQQGAMVERIVLDVLGDLTLEPSRRTFLVPAAFTPGDKKTTQMHLIPGFRMNELCGVLNRIIEHLPERNIVERAFYMKQALLSLCIANLTVFQDGRVQSLLHEKLAPYETPYPYLERLTIALNYTFSSLGLSHMLTTAVLDDLNFIAGQLQELPAVYFRDAILKNQILFSPSFSRSEIRRLAVEVEEGKLRWQRNNKHSRLLVRFLDFVLSFDQSTAMIYNVDFEQASERVAVVDDWNQVLTAEVFGLPYETGIDYACRRIGIRRQDYHFSVVFRSLRAWARRLYYRNEKPQQGLDRYRYETLAYHYSTAAMAVKRLQEDVNDDKFLCNLSAALELCQPPSLPWPCHIQAGTKMLE